MRLRLLANFLERQTLDQADNELWVIERRKRITASTGGIAKMRSTTKRSKKVEMLLYSKFRGNAATQYGSYKEESTRQQYETYMRQNGHPNLKVEKCGLFVSLENPWLASSPDGVVYDPDDSIQPLGIIEIKNPYSLRQLTLAESIKNSSFCLELNKNDGTSDSRKNMTYYQVQCQLHCTNRAWCDFVLRTEINMHVERIQRDTLWWNSVLPKLENFYFSALLPELASPRHRQGGIREPSH